VTQINKCLSYIYQIFKDFNQLARKRYLLHLLIARFFARNKAQQIWEEEDHSSMPLSKIFTLYFNSISFSKKWSKGFVSTIMERFNNHNHDGKTFSDSCSLKSERY